ncbi:MAG TPA: hypothetical protein VK308_10155 [Pyrinomonadaceae bacterium]|nr:hypothetical protein [Pyrinomonadaceae bacterium]
MKETPIKQETIRQFLLGDLPESERIELEDAFLGDEQLFEQIEDGENDLVDDYVGERLGALERKLFENYYLALPENRAKVETARVMRRGLQNQKTEAVNVAVAETSAEKPASFWQSIQNFFASGALVPVAGFAVLLFLIGGLWLAFRSQPNNDIVYSPTPAPTIISASPTPNPTPETNFNSPVNTNRISPSVSPTVQRDVNAAPRETPRTIEPKDNVRPTPRKTPPAQSTVTLALITGLVRGDGAANKLVLPKNAGQVRLTFDLPAKKYKEIEARIETIAGEKIWNGKIKQSGGRAALNLPAKLFADEDYLLIVSGADEAGKRADFSQLYFNSQRK